mmetsp:Transcript_34082/g.98193  ORF Transcript_34082/g.98193 Transcript_34082/m.98193 type:complete len:81 (-) Transcript_34082:169-411(-)
MWANGPPKSKQPTTTATSKKVAESKECTNDKHHLPMKDPAAAEDENPFWIVTAEGIVKLKLQTSKKFHNTARKVWMAKTA